MAKLKTIIAATALASGAMLATQGAYAVTCSSDIGTITTTPFTCDVQKTGTGLFLDTINFEVDPAFALVTITSIVDNITFFSIPIFENDTDSEFAADNDGQHFGVDLSEFAGQIAGPDYHIHPQGLLGGGGSSYELTFSAAASPVPVPAALWLFMSGLTGLGVLARRRATRIA